MLKLIQSFSEKHCRQQEHYEVKSSRACFNTSHQRKIVQMTPYRKQAEWNIHRFCQEFILSTTQIYGSSLLVTYKTQISH